MPGARDKAITEFEKVLKTDPDNANAIFNLGMVKWQSKFDVDGAIAGHKRQSSRLCLRCSTRSRPRGSLTTRPFGR